MVLYSILTEDVGSQVGFLSCFWNTKSVLSLLNENEEYRKTISSY